MDPELKSRIWPWLPLYIVFVLVVGGLWLAIGSSKGLALVPVISLAVVATARSVWTRRNGNG